MQLRIRLRMLAAALMCGALLCGCAPVDSSSMDEDKEPHFITGKNRANTMDYAGAIEAFEEALEVNPRSAAAHFELGCLFADKVPDPAAAIYHFQKFLALRPDSPQRGNVNDRIQVMKQDLVKNVLPPTFTAADHRRFEQLADENQRLTLENQKLRDEVGKWRAYYASQTAVSQQPQAVDQPAADQTPRVAAPSSTPNVQPHAAAEVQRTHTVKAGETPAAIARKYGVRLDAFMAANPGLVPTKMRVGQVVNLPSP